MISYGNPVCCVTQKRATLFCYTQNFCHLRACPTRDGTTVDEGRTAAAVKAGKTAQNSGRGVKSVNGQP